MLISDWSSDVCSSDLLREEGAARARVRAGDDAGLFQLCHRARRLYRPARQRRAVRRLYRPAHLHAARHEIRNLPPAAAEGARSLYGERLFDRRRKGQIGRASCRERVGQYVKVSVAAVSLTKKKTKNVITQTTH